MKQRISLCCGLILSAVLSSCGVSEPQSRPYNEGINLIPTPQSLVETEGRFVLKNGMQMGATTPEAQKVAQFFATKLKSATGYTLPVAQEGVIALNIDPTVAGGNEAYTLRVTPDSVLVAAPSAHGLYYGMQSFMQLLPAEVESSKLVRQIAWSAPAVEIADAPRFGYRGVMMDPCRHFMTVDDLKRMIDALSLFKINRLHWHLTEDQGWRIEIKKYPKLTEVGSRRIEGEGYEHSGYYTQEEVKEVVAYAAERFITVVPEIELPGHELSAIAAYPELSCQGKPITPRIIWGVEDIVMCAGKEETFHFLEDVLAEVAQLFPSEYIHIGGDECPKSSWKQCPLCQKRIRDEHLQARDGHTAEERLQSYFVQRMERYLATLGKKIIGWDEILEGGLSPTATVMSWRGEKGGIAAALTGHDAIMTPGSNGLYLDHYQGDECIEPVAIGGYSTLEKVYSYNPVPDTLVAMKMDKHIIGVQCNVWAEYLYTNAHREYMTFPRAIALAEVAWSQLDRKNYADFERRIENACVRLDAHGVNYHIPLPEQPGGSSDKVAFTDQIDLTFQTVRPVRMVYTLDGSEPTLKSETYTAPIRLTESATVKIASVLKSGKMSRVRTIQVEKQPLAPAATVEGTKPGLMARFYDGAYLDMDCFAKAAPEVVAEKEIKSVRELVTFRPTSESMRDVAHFSSEATGYIQVPEDGVYYFASNLEQVWIDGKLLIDNGGEVKSHSRRNASVALAAGLHPVKLVFLGQIIGGRPSYWSSGNLNWRKSDAEKFVPVDTALFQH